MDWASSKPPCQGRRTVTWATPLTMAEGGIGAAVANKDSPVRTLRLLRQPSPQRHPTMNQPGHTTRTLPAAIHTQHLRNAEMAAREMGGLSLADALLLCELLAKTDVARYERAALRWVQRFIDERLPPVTEVALAAAALAELRHGRRSVGVEALKSIARR
jgi:hypothetical protein